MPGDPAFRQTAKLDDYDTWSRKHSGTMHP
jgi:hypothetical protein